MSDHFPARSLFVRPPRRLLRATLSVKRHDSVSVSMMYQPTRNFLNALPVGAKLPSGDAIIGL